MGQVSLGLSQAVPLSQVWVMDALSVVLVVSVLGLSLSGTSLIVKLVYGELSQLRGEVRALRDRTKSLATENEGLRNELEGLRGLVNDSLRKGSSLEDRLSVVERLVREEIKGGDGGRPKSLGKPVDPHIDLKVIALRKEGLSIRAIARKLGVSKSRVHRIVKKAFPNS